MADQRVKGIIFASITSFFWGFLAIALKVASGILEPVTIVWFRFLTAFLILLVYFLIKKPEYLKILTKPPLYLVFASFGLAINYLAFLYGVKLTSPGSAVVIVQLGPISLGLVGLLFFRERISKRQALGFLLAGAGLFVFYQDNIRQIATGHGLYNMGILWVVVAAMAWVVYASLQKMLVKSHPAQQLNLFLFGLPVVLFLPFVNFNSLLSLSFGNWMLMLYLGLNTLIAYGSLAVAFKYLEANKISIIVTMNPIITFIAMAILAWWEVTWIKPEMATSAGLLAALMVVSGTILAVAFARQSAKKSVKEIISPAKSENIKRNT